ncbi:MAG: hypothetical protein ABMA64_25165 [Myxococcota bacterium]
MTISGCESLKPFEQGPNPNGPAGTGVLPPVDCTNYTFNEQTYNCDTMDRCDFSQESIPMRLACCDCDPTLCDAPPAEECPPDPDVEPPPPPELGVESCMACHNGSNANDYGGTGMSNPHPTGVAGYIKCSECHGGDPEGLGKDASHVPVPPQIGDDTNLVTNPTAYFNFLTLTGVDKYPDYEVNGKTYAAMDWLRFQNPGDTRVVAAGYGCGQTGCHGGEHADWFPKGFIANEPGFYSNTLFTVGSPGAVPETAELYGKTASDYGFRERTDPTWVYDANVIGPVNKNLEIPEYAAWGDTSGMYNNQIYDANTIANYRYNANAAGQYVNAVIPGSPLEHVVIESVVFQCGDCHAGSKGANNRYADFRSSGCSVCHMNYSMDGRSRTTDPNINKIEPANPDAIAAPERPHAETHQLRNVAKIMPNGAFVRGVADYACVGCHQGSNRTVLQYWGIRLDQNADVVNGFQYPANPVTFATTQFDTRLFDPAVANNTFNGRNFNQYLLEEDYDGDGRDDTSPDVHYEAGLGCIDCHGSRDVHNGTEGDPNNGKIWSKMDQTVGVLCENCHGSVETYAETTACEDYTGATTICTTDRFGNQMRNVSVDGVGNYWLTSRLDGLRHFIPQVRDVTIINTKQNPLTGQAIYDPIASYAMGAADGDSSNGVGPMQTNPNLYAIGFTHMDDLSCDSCHSSWENNCEGCHLQLQYNANPANYFFSNTTGERIAVQVTNADFTYILPNWYFLEVTTRGEIGAAWGGMKPFYRYVDLNGNLADGITFSDRNGLGNNPNYGGTGAFPAMSHNRIAPHSIRGKQTAQYEGSKNCVACHLNDAQIANFDANAEYTTYFADIENRNYAGVNFALLQQHIGQNTNNHLNSPYYVHMTAGLGTGLLLADADGCPVNPLDANPNRIYCVNGAPADNFDLNNVVYDWDKVAEYTGASNVSLTKPILDLAAGVPLRGQGGSTLSGPLNPNLLSKLADPTVGLVLDSWIDANAAAGGNAADFLQNQ